MIIVTIQHHGKNKWLEKNELVRMGKKRAHTEIMSGVVGCVWPQVQLPPSLSFFPSLWCLSGLSGLVILRLHNRSHIDCY